MTSTPNRAEDEFAEKFAEAANNWNLEKLYTDLGATKQKQNSGRRKELTPIEKACLRGLLCGFSPTEIALELHRESGGLRVELSRRLYRYVETLTDQQLKDYRNVCDLLERAGYKTRLANQSQQTALGEGAKSFALPEKIAPVRNWVGRSQELETLKAQILDPDTRAITITAICVVGLAGIGKTTLASQLVRQLHSEKASFVVAAWESLRSVTGKPPRFDSIMDSLLLILSNGEITAAVTILDDYFKKTERLVKLLKDQSSLVVLDNVETVLKIKQAKRAGYFADDCAEYAWLFQQLAETEHQSKVIFTSRENLAQLQRRETHTLRLGGLDQQSAVTLLESFELTATKEELAKLAKRYDGHPKALEMVAVLIRDEDEFQGRVGKFLEDVDWLLVNTLDELIEQVTNRLSEEELTCLSQISVYETPEYQLSVAGIAAQMPEISKRDLKENIIEALKRRQLLDYNRDYESYQMHPLVQEKASNLLNPESSRIAHRQAYHYFLNIAQPEFEWREFEDIKPLLRAHYHACQAQDWDEAAAAISRTYDYLRQKGYFDLVVDLYSELIPDNWQDGEQLVTSPITHSDILLRLGNSYHSVGKWEIAREYYQHCLSICRHIGDRKGEARTLCYMGINTGDKTAIEYLQESLAIAKDIRESHIEYKALEYLGVAYSGVGDYQKAAAFHKQTLEVARQIGFEEGVGVAIGNLGYMYERIGEYKMAKDYMEQYLEISVNLGHPKRQANALCGLASIHNNLTEYQTAINYAQKCREICRSCEDRHIESYAVKQLGIAYRGLKKYPESIQLFDWYLRSGRELGAHSSEADALCNLGIIYRELGQIEQSIENLQSSLSIFHQIGNRADEAKVLIELVQSFFKRNIVLLETIQDYLNQAEQICMDLHLPLLTEVKKIKVNMQENNR